MTGLPWARTTPPRGSVVLRVEHDDPDWNEDGSAAEVDKNDPRFEIVRRDFPTHAEAAAFVEGIEYANDSMIEVWEL